MTRSWIVIEDAGGSRREELAAGRTRLGGPGADVVVAGARGELHVWDDPPRVVFAGGSEAPRAEGSEFEELSLHPGSEWSWGAARLRYEQEAASLEPLEPEALGAWVAQEEAAAWRRVRAGILVEQGLCDRAAARRWQAAVRSGDFRPDACAEEILGASTVPADDQRVLQRSGALLRDLLMAPVVRGARGAGRRARQAARGGLAFVIAQGAAFLVFCLIVLALLVLLRLQGSSVDALLDRLLLRGSG